MAIKRSVLVLLMQFVFAFAFAQLKWTRVDSLFGTLPASVHVYKTTDSLDGSPNIAYYFEADLKDKNLEFTTDTTLNRRLTPSDFYLKNNKPLLVVNAFGTKIDAPLNTVNLIVSFAMHPSCDVTVK